MDILSAKIGKFIFKNKYFVNFTRLFVLFLFFYAVIFGLIDGSENNKVTKALFWSLFWSFFMVTTLCSFGRIFCSICPKAYIGKFVTKIGLKKPMPEKLKNPYIGIFFLVVGFWGFYYLNPRFLKSSTVSALFFLFFFLLSMVFFFLYKDMEYCKNICPVSTATRAFGKIGFTWLNTKEDECATCKTFDCTKACSYNLQPFNFNKRGSVSDCTLCMDCARACDNAKFDIKSYSYAARQNFKVKKTETWAILLLTGAVSITMALHHGLMRLSTYNEYPWMVQGEWIKTALNLPQTLDVGGFLVYLYSMIATVLITAGGMYIGAKIMKLSFEKVFYTLCYAFAPLFIIGGLGHIFEFFFYRYASDITNAFIQIFMLDVPYVEPLASRSDEWVKVFGNIKHGSI